MLAEANALWSPGAYCLSAPVAGLNDRLAAAVYERVCRTDFSAPGFCLVDLGTETSSRSQRAFMVALKTALAGIHRSRAARDLAVESAARFDQQATTKLHRDGGPDESFLMLGYEPSPVSSEVRLADFSRAAFELGLGPGEFLQKHNPMFGPGEELLRPYTTRVDCFSNRHAQILLINNSLRPYNEDTRSWQGVLHTATVHDPCEASRRVVNSMMIASVSIGAVEPVSLAEQEEFVSTAVVRRRGYDKPHLDDE